MKSLFTLSILLLSVKLFAQCNSPLPDDIFSQLHAAVAGVQDGRTQTLKDISSSNCLSTNQIGLFTSLLNSDQEKYEYLLFAKKYCSDIQNYASLSSQIRDNGLRQQFQNQAQQNQVLIVTAPVKPQQPLQNNQSIQPQIEIVNQMPKPVQPQPVSMPHSPVKGYTGRVGCPQPIDNDMFLTFIESVEDENFESSKLKILNQENSCFSKNQIKDIIDQFTHESNKLEAAKLLLPKTHDLDNFPSLESEFTFNSSKKALLDYYNVNSEKSVSKNAVTEILFDNKKGNSANAVSNLDFSNILKAAKLESFDAKRTDIIGSSLGNKMLSTDHVEKLAKLFSFDSYRLDFLKFAYPKTTDKENFGRLETLFSFDSYKTDFRKIIKGSKMNR